MSVKEHIKHVDGVKKSNIVLYALSTCGWCKKTKALLNDMQADYHYVDVDLLGDADKEEAVAEITKWNPDCSFPTLVVDNKSCIVGFDVEKIKEAIKHAD
jgi:glutaredoxin-like protein NrdH